MYNISIVIPVFNEDQNISILVEEIFISLDNDKRDAALLFGFIARFVNPNK